jgi:arylsulfatase A-like enzyme
MMASFLVHDLVVSGRRLFVRGLSLALLALLLEPAPVLAQPSAPGAASPAPRPDILLILADDAGFSDFGCYGSEIRTPNLDALAAGGLRFTQFYNGSRCCPSRASLLTGLYAQQTGVGLMTGGGSALPGYTGSLNDSCVTLADVLKQAGYQTYMSGKWHVGDMLPTTRGFDRFYGFYTGYSVNSYNPDMMALFPPGPMHSYPPGGFYATDAITDYALDFINQGRKDPAHPWFTYLAYQASHFPVMAPEAEVKPYVPVYEQGWDKIRDARLAKIKQLGILPASSLLSPRSAIPRPRIAEQDDGLTGPDAQVNPAWDSLPPDRRKDLAYRMAVYAAMTEHMDRDVGRVIADLRAHGDLHNTLVLFLSDNGACAEWAPFGFDLALRYPNDDGTHGTGHGGDWNSFVKPVLHTGAALATMGQRGGTGIGYGSGWANACNTPFRMYKHYDHEGGISTPLIAYWPDVIKDAGALRAQVGDVIDLMPTLAELGGATYPTTHDGHAILPMEGRSFVPALRSNTNDSRTLFWEHEGNRAVRVGVFKLVSLDHKPWELYDMSKDREELNDLAAQMPDKVKELSAQWEAWAWRCHVYPSPSEPNHKPGPARLDD